MPIMNFDEWFESEHFKPQMRWPLQMAWDAALESRSKNSQLNSLINIVRDISDSDLKEIELYAEYLLFREHHGK